MKRLPDWRARLSAVVQTLAKTPFAWGTNDCLTGLLVPVVNAVTGQDLASEIPAYASAAGTKRALVDKGFDGLPSLAAAHFEPIAPAFARAGDLAIVSNEAGEPCFGVVLGERIGVITETGYGTMARNKAKQTYRVGQ